MYNGSRKWGSVRVTTKRGKSLHNYQLFNFTFSDVVYPEQHKYKKSLQKDRMAARSDMIKDSSIQYSIAIKAQSPRKKMTAIVVPEKVHKFQRALLSM